MGREDKRGRHDREDDHYHHRHSDDGGNKDLKIQKLQIEFDELKSKLSTLVCLKPFEFISGKSTNLPMLIKNTEPLLHYELDTLKKQNDILTKKVFDLEKDLNRKTSMATKDPLLEANNKLIAEKEKLVNENKDLQLKLQVYTLFSNQLKKEYNEIRQRLSIVEEENERLASQMQQLQQMQMSTFQEQSPEEDDVHLQLSPTGSPLSSAHD